MEKMILADGSIIELEAGASLSSLGVVSENKDKMLETWDKFTDENLKSVQITDGNDAVIAEYSDLVLVSVTSTEKEDGTILTMFSLREKTELERLKEQTAQQEETIDMLTGCILEMSEIIYV